MAATETQAEASSRSASLAPDFLERPGRCLRAPRPIQDDAAVKRVGRYDNLRGRGGHNGQAPRAFKAEAAAPWYQGPLGSPPPRPP